MSYHTTLWPPFNGCIYIYIWHENVTVSSPKCLLRLITLNGAVIITGHTGKEVLPSHFSDVIVHCRCWHQQVLTPGILFVIKNATGRDSERGHVLPFLTKWEEHKSFGLKWLSGIYSHIDILFSKLTIKFKSSISTYVMEKRKEQSFSQRCLKCEIAN